MCSCCFSTKKKEEFYHLRGNNKLYVHSTCNQYNNNRQKNIQKENDLLTRKKSKLEASLNAPILNISTTISQTSTSSSKSLSDLIDLELDDNAYVYEEFSPELFQKINEGDNANRLLYTLDKIEKFVTKQFQNAENLNKSVQLIFEIELDSKLIESVFSN
ncbi:32433_t:CDS:1 [Racocetra persica]|uniref:32433_t:CDS:1 n=1 Tax=Racocetra persica TaxID=160502 RepID=A0ACA9NFT2_9GLOM|nr:32433_t:CDS:1 [Racocetra persica]